VSLRDELDRVMPGWDRWYPSVFDAAQDLGLIRARVCAPSSLLLSNRHAAINGEALQAFRERWAIEYDPEVDEPDPRAGRRGSRQQQHPRHGRPAPAGRKLRQWKR
jgi:hypothetical protein